MPAGSRWYCFDPADSGTVGEPEWIPQGVSTSADAGTGGREALLVSWYDDREAPAKGVRVSFLDAATNTYRHVLLVYPYIDGAGKPTYEIVGRPQGGLHAGRHRVARQPAVRRRHDARHPRVRHAPDLRHRHFRR